MRPTTNIPTPALRPQPTSWAALPAHIRARLAAENVHSPGTWLQLGAARWRLFGITRRTAELLDDLAALEVLS